jgi:hypothetical protein
MIVAPVRAQVPTPTGTIYGQVLDRTAGAAPSGVTVTLEWEENGKARSRTTVTDAEGRYRFAELPLDLAIAFTVSATVNGKSLRREDVAISTWTPSVQADLESVSAASDPAQVHIARITTILPPSQGQDLVPVIEFVEVHNAAGAPFAQVDAQGRSIGFQFSLPEGAEGAEVQGEGLQTAIEGNAVLLTEPLRADPETTLFSVSYTLQRDGRLRVARSVGHHVAEYLVLVGSSEWALRATGFQQQDPTDIHGVQYVRYARADVAAGSPVELTFQPQGAKGRTVPVVLVVLIGVLAVVAGGAIGTWAAYSRRAGRGAAPSRSASAAPQHSADGVDGILNGLTRDELDSVKQVYLGLIAQLDEHHAAGDLPHALHDRLRCEHKTRLAAVMARLEAS